MTRIRFKGSPRCRRSRGSWPSVSQPLVGAPLGRGHPRPNRAGKKPGHTRQPKRSLPRYLAFIISELEYHERSVRMSDPRVSYQEFAKIAPAAQAALLAMGKAVEDRKSVV